MTRIFCLHTAAVHAETFGRLFVEIAPEVEVSHAVRADWLGEARSSGLTADLRGKVARFLDEQSRQNDAVLCTCSSLGPVVDEMQGDAAAIARGPVLRIDTPLMRRAVSHDGTVLVAICLESTRAPTLALLDRAFAERGRQGCVEIVMCAEAWRHFERGDTREFAAAIAADVRRVAAGIEPLGCIVLAQASMAIAEPLLADMDVPVYSSPRLAVVETLRAAGIKASV